MLTALPLPLCGGSPPAPSSRIHVLSATVALIEGKVHYPHAEAPDETSEAILEFLG